MIPMPEKERMERMQRNPRCFLYPLNEDDAGAALRRLSRFRRSHTGNAEYRQFGQVHDYSFTLVTWIILFNVSGHFKAINNGRSN